MEVGHVFKCLFENVEKQELVYAWYEDLNGFIIYEECHDCLQQKLKLTKTQFFKEYTRVW